ncbi:MAG: hypothetical protein VXZ82_21985 [Planctomycetota bacterium]|nr:hypothetical protein [Planctomycetota bacterium]
MRGTIGLRGGTYTLADEMLAAVVGLRAGNESAETQRKPVAEQFKVKIYRRPVEIFLNNLLQYIRQAPHIVHMNSAS